MSKDHTWEDVVRECEDILQLNEHAVSPLMSNLPNIIRDMVFKLCILPIASQQASRVDRATVEPDWRCKVEEVLNKKSVSL